MGFSNELIGGIQQSAAALGMPPEWLGAIISYETAGTFNPTKKGPTTKWGTHKGLIQFGEPQAEEYGVDWSDPIGSQLGADGAVVKYFRENGWRPGMSFMDAYSIVNTGAPGNYHLSDEAAGGAPGTVADKVRYQMKGHMERAATLFGGEVDPKNYNGFVSAMFSGSAEEQQAQVDEAAQAVADAPASAERSGGVQGAGAQRPRPRPFSVALEWSPIPSRRPTPPPSAFRGPSYYVQSRYAAPRATRMR